MTCRDMLLEYLNVRDEVYADNDHDLARAIIGDPTRPSIADGILSVLDSYVSMGHISRTRVPDDLNRDPRIEGGKMVTCYSLTESGRKLVKHHLQVDQPASV